MMVNDTNTLNGALSELGEVLASNLTEMGVTASASDGLTTLANKILLIEQGGSCIHLKFSEDSYVAVGGVCTVDVELQQNYEPLANKTVVLTGSDSSTYSAVTDSDGVASFTVTVLDDVTFTATYEGVTAQCEVYFNSQLFYDDCSSSSRLSEYTGVSIRNTNNNIVALTYDSSENAYSLYRENGTGDGFYGYSFPLSVSDNLKIRVNAKLTSSNAYSQCLVGISNSTDQGVNGTWEAVRIRGDKTVDILRNSNGSIHVTTNVAIFNGNYVTIELVKNGTSITETIYDANENVLNTHTWLGNTYTTPYFFVGANTSTQGARTYIKEILAEITQ